MLSKTQPVSKGYIQAVWFHLQNILEMTKIIEVKDRLVAARDQERWEEG